MAYPHGLTLPAVAQGARVGILGGSFDPPHLCHQLLALSFLAIEGLDELWVIPCANHALKTGLSDFNHRLAMCTIAFARLNHVHVLDLENKLTTPNYTSETIKAILKIRPDLKLMLCLGSDLVNQFSSWHQAKEIIKVVTISIFERANYPILTLPKLLENAHLHQGYALPDTASTNLRDLLGNQNHHSGQCIDWRVLQYIKNHKLYCKA